MAGLEGCSVDEARARCLEVDRIRELFTRYFFGPSATEPAQYDLVVNTAGVPLDDVTSVVAAMVRRDTEGDSPIFAAATSLPQGASDCAAKIGTVPRRSPCVDPLAGIGGRRQ